MAASYRQQQQGRLDSSSSQAGTLNRTQVERRGATFISARNRLDSNDSYFEGGGSGRRSPAGLKRIAKSQDRLNSTSASLGGSRGNLAQQKVNAVSSGNLSSSAGYNQGPPRGARPISTSSHQQPPSPQTQPQPPYQQQAQYNRQQPQYQQQQQQYPYPSQQTHDQGNSPNYSNLPPYGNSPETDSPPNINNNFEKQISRESRSSTSSLQNQGSVRSVKPLAATTATDDSDSQEFEKIRLEYLRKGKLFIDTVFPASDSSIYFSRLPPYNFEWKRPKDVTRRYNQAPEFILYGANQYDVRQGVLGDCWLVAAIACLSSSEHRYLFDRVVPQRQNFDDGWYAGVFRFNFWHYGTWQQVIVDDFLPTVSNRLYFVHSSETNEFWAALVEKAYAKLYGSYEALKSGMMADALTDLTGGLCESYTFRGPQANLPSNIVDILFKALERQALIGCGIFDKGSGQRDLPNGLVEGHSYSVTDLRRILNGQQPVTLIRVRNPHGDHKEWRGRWSEWSEEFQQISPQDRERLGLIKRDDGEFWMDFDDFLENFDSLDICNLTADLPNSPQRKWFSVDHHGRWIKGFNAGGRPSSSAHWSNPQYFLQLKDSDEDEDNACSVLIQLIQKDRRKIKQKQPHFLYIGFSVYQYEKGNALPLKKDFFEYHQKIASSGAFINGRQVSCRLTLPPGEYVVVPCTYDADEEADFYIRFFFEKGNVVEYCDEKPEKVDIPPPATSPEWKEQEEAFKNFFYRVSGEDMEVNASELRDAMNESLSRDPHSQEVSMDACRSFISLMDVDGSGRLSFYEFQYLWHHIRNWKRIFNQCDENKSGMMEVRELRAAINNFGYKVSHQTITSLMLYYADSMGRISLDSFLALMARLMKAYNTFNKLQTDGKVTLGLEQWLNSTLSL